MYLRGETPFETALVRPLAFYAEHNIETILGCRSDANRCLGPVRLAVTTVVARRSTDCSLRRADGNSAPLGRRAPIVDGIYGLRTVQDADLIRAETSAGRRVVVVGMGFIGSEVAASLRQKDLDVVAIEPSKTLARPGAGRRRRAVPRISCTARAVSELFSRTRSLRSRAPGGVDWVLTKERPASRMRFRRRRHRHRTGGGRARRQRRSRRQRRGGR